MPSNNFQIRLATSDDVPSILAFIKGLAEFEYLSNEVTVTETELQKSLFGPNPAAEVVIGFAGGEPAGFAVFCLAIIEFEDTWATTSPIMTMANRKWI